MNGSVKVELARHDERLQAISKRISRAEKLNERGINKAKEVVDAHLVTLNHAHELAVEVQRTYVARTFLDQIITALTDKINVGDGVISSRVGTLHEETDKRLQKLENANSTLQGKLLVVGSIASLLGMVLGGVAVRFIAK